MPEPPEERDPTGSRWDEIDRLFEAALEQPPEARAAYVERACGGDLELRNAVRSLLERSEQAGSRLVAPDSALIRAAFERPSGGPPADPVLSPGDRVGAYRIVGELGRGGMATVYEAERADGAFEQRVAIKVLRRDADSDEVVRRFVAERQILSGLAHRNIARLLDGGAIRGGRPYLVMECVDGEPITAWADRHRLTVEARLDLFRQMCEAVAYAHARLVVHRDLKPSNVLVNGEGLVKLLDFGIAKLLDVPGPSPEIPPTRWMTPEYASPEQILGRPVTTAADVHGLGVILYELLTGHRPFGGDTASGYELQRAICEDLPERPSFAVTTTTERRDRDGHPPITPETVAQERGTDPGRLRHTLSGDLDAVLLKALRKEPEQRYGSVQALLEDVERYRAGFPVEARAGAAAYRARKFVRRNWLSVSLAATIASILAAAVIVQSAQQAETARERDRANAAAELATREADNARLVIAFLADVFRGRDPSDAPPDTMTARELLAWGRERIDAEFGDRPEVQAELLTVMGSAHYNLGLIDDAIGLHRRSVRLRREVHGDRSEPVALGLTALALARRDDRDFEAALPAAREALSIRREVLGPDDTRIAGSLQVLGTIQRDLGHADSAEALLRQAVEIHERSTGADSSGHVASILDLAYVLRARGDLDEAERLYLEGIPRLRELEGDRSLDLATNLNNLGYLYRVRDRYAEAVPLYREAIAISSSLYGRGHPNTLLLANNLASVLHELGRTAELIGLLSENVAAAEAQWPNGHWRVGSAHRNLGLARLRSGDPAAAATSIRVAARSFEQTLGPDHDWTVFAGADLAVTRIRLGRPDLGRPVLDRLHRRIEQQRDSTGQLPRGTAGQLEAFLSTLEDALPAEVPRFRALMPPAGSS